MVGTSPIPMIRRLPLRSNIRTLTTNGSVISSRWHHLSSLLCAVSKVTNSNGLNCVFQVDTITFCLMIKGESLRSDSPPDAGISVFDPSQSPSNTRQLTVLAQESVDLSQHIPHSKFPVPVSSSVCTYGFTHPIYCMCHYTHSLSPQCHKRVSLSLPLPSFLIQGLIQPKLVSAIIYTLCVS